MPDAYQSLTAWPQTREEVSIPAKRVGILDAQLARNHKKSTYLASAAAPRRSCDKLVPFTDQLPDLKRISTPPGPWERLEPWVVDPGSSCQAL